MTSVETSAPRWRAIARSRSETARAPSLNSTIAPIASLRFTIGATMAELQRAVAAVAAVLPAHRQARDAPLDHRVDGAGRRGQAGAVVVGAEPDVREHALAVADGRRRA